MPLALHHIALRTADVAALAEFYKAVFDFRVVRDSLPRSLWLGLGGGAVLMLEEREAGEPGIPPDAMELLAFRVTGEEREDIKRKAVATGCYAGETPFTVYLRDPDGRRLGVSTYDLEAGV